jgi:hypothetical protein
MNYATEVEFLRAEVDKCHASMHSQIETINLLMKRNIELKQKRQWVELTDEEIKGLATDDVAIPMTGRMWIFVGDIEAKLKEKNT